MGFHSHHKNNHDKLHDHDEKTHKSDSSLSDATLFMEDENFQLETFKLDFIDTYACTTSTKVNTPLHRTELERSVVKKLDRHILPFVSVIFLFGFLDRVNIGNAKITTMEQDLNLSDTQFGWAQSIFFLTYTLLEIPSNIILAKTYPSRWLSGIMVAWGLSTLCTAFVKDFTGLFLCRLFLGVAQSGLPPGLIFYLTFFYLRKEMSTRISIYFSMGTIAGAFGGVLSYALSKLHGTLGLSGWQWIFLLEGIPTILIGMLIWFVLPNYPKDTKFLTLEEKEVAISRLEKDTGSSASSKSSSHDKHTFTWKELKDTLFDPLHILFMLHYFCVMTPMQSIALSMPLIIHGLGYEGLQANLMSSPPYLLAFIFTLLVSRYSDTQTRSYPVILSSLFTLTGFLILLFAKSVHIQYAALFIAAIGIFPTVPITCSWFSNNLSTVTARAVGSAMIVSVGNSGGFIAGMLFRKDDAPHYKPALIVNVCVVLVGILISICIRLLLIKRNTERERITRKLAAYGDSAANSGFKYML